MIFFAEKGTKLTDIEQNKARVRAFFDALNCGDVEAVVNAYSDEGSCWTSEGTLISGTMNKEQIRAGSGAIFEAFPEGLEFSFTQ
jgi:ketosteroid isomerase-like protein